MGKQTGIYCYFTSDILTTVLQKCPLCNLLPKISLLSKSLNFIGCHGNLKAKFEKTYLKIIPSEAISEIKLKLFRNVYNINLYKNGDRWQLSFH